MSSQQQLQLVNKNSIGTNWEPAFPTIAHCGIYLIYHYGEIWSNSRIADEVKQRMNSNTGAGNISWYKVNLKKGKLKFENYLDVTQEKKSAKLKPEKKPVKLVEQKQDDFDNPLTVDDDSVGAKEANPITQLAIDFKRQRTEKSFALLYNRLKPGMLYHAMSILKVQTLADDVLNVAFTKIWQKIDQYNRHWCFSTWAYKIVRNEAMQLVRREKRFSTLEDKTGGDRTDAIQYEEFSVNSAEESWVPDYFEDEEEDYSKSMYEKVLKQIHDMPKTYKEIMIDRELGGMKYKDIAKKHKININSVKTRIKRARMQIQGDNQEYVKIVERKNRKRNNEKEGNTNKEELDIYEQARIKVQEVTSQDILDSII